jgi:hypothetical protein
MYSKPRKVKEIGLKVEKVRESVLKIRKYEKVC